jgi:uncharacterized tellurite resistance protein B-like protein
MSEYYGIFWVIEYDKLDIIRKNKGRQVAVLNLLKKVKVQTLSFEKHPCRDLDMEIKVHYLNGLALVAQEDGNFCEKEKEYLSILINSFELDKETLEEYVEFAQNPDEERLIEMMNVFATKDIKYNFMIDAMMVAQRDGNFDEAEQAIIEQYFEMFKITEDEAKDLTSLFEMFYVQDGNGLFRYFGKQDKYDTFLIKKELFQYLVDYYKIDFEYELKEDEKRILEFELFKPILNDGQFSHKTVKEVMVNPVNNAQACIFLNNQLLNNNITVNSDNKVLLTDDSKDLIINLNNSDIVYINNEFQIHSISKEKEKITGITLVFIWRFTTWINTYFNENYKLLAFGNKNDYNDYVDISNFSIENEWYGNYYYINEYRHTHGNAVASSKFPINLRRSKILYSSFYEENNYTYESNLTSFRLMKIPENKE